MMGFVVKQINVGDLVSYKSLSITPIGLFSNNVIVHFEEEDLSPIGEVIGFLSQYENIAIIDWGDTIAKCDITNLKIIKKHEDDFEDVLITEIVES